MRLIPALTLATWPANTYTPRPKVDPIPWNNDCFYYYCYSIYTKKIKLPKVVKSSVDKHLSSLVAVIAVLSIGFLRKNALKRVVYVTAIIVLLPIEEQNFYLILLLNGEKSDL